MKTLFDDEELQNQLPDPDDDYMTDTGINDDPETDEDDLLDDEDEQTDAEKDELDGPANDLVGLPRDDDDDDDL